VAATQGRGAGRYGKAAAPAGRSDPALDLPELIRLLAAGLNVLERQIGIALELLGVTLGLLVRANSGGAFGGRMLGELSA